MSKHVSVLFVYASLFLLTACGVTIERFEALQKQNNQCVSDLSQATLAVNSCHSELKTVTVQTEELTTKTKTYEDLMGNLKEEVSQGKVKISQMQDKLSVNLIDKILFSVGSYKIEPEGKQVLKKIAGVLKNIKDKRIQVEGHTDNAPVYKAKQYDNNWELSVLRATEVVKTLSLSGVSESKLSAAGFASNQPIATNKTEEGRRLNRRIEIVLLPDVKLKDTTKLDQ